MLQQFVLRQAINLVVSLVVKLVDKHQQSFSPEQTKAEVQARVKDLIPESMWGEEWVEQRVFAVTDFMVDRMCTAVSSAPEFTDEVLTALSEQNLEGAVQAVKSFYMRTLGMDVQANPAVAQSFDDSFADQVLRAYDNEGSQQEEEVQPQSSEQVQPQSTEESQPQSSDEGKAQ